MKSGIIRKFLGAYLFLILIAILVLNLFVGSRFQDYYEKKITDKLISNAILSSNIIKNDLISRDQKAARKDVARLSRELKLRVTVITLKGKVLGDSEQDPDLMENHLSREEVKAAIQNGYGESSRLSETLSLRMKYVAVPVKENGRILGVIRLAVPLTEIEQEIRVINRVFLLGGILAALVTLVIGYFISRNISLPLRKIEETARSIAEGDLSKRADVRVGGEIGGLACSLNRMTDELQAKMGNLEKMDKVRTDFVANVSHELKTPLTSIKGFIETLEDGAIDDKNNARRFLAIIRKHSERLSNIINDLLKLAEIESESKTQGKGLFDMKALLDEVVWGFGHMLSEKNQQLNVDYNGVDFKVKGDKNAVEQVFVNLIDNAIKYTGEKGDIRVSLFEEEGSIMTTVEDSGIGIPSEDLDRIFERFYRVDKARSREIGGTGLGLSIVKHIVISHKGHIDIESEIGKGTKITVIFPKNI
jgi:two-component system phosphate regulon sensor histidine kinase PhoR